MIRTAIINTTTGIVEFVLMFELVVSNPPPGFSANYIAVTSDIVNVGWTWDGTNLVAPPTPAPVIPQTVTQKQARLALFGAGLLDQVNAAVTAAGGAVLITWEYSDVINRNDALIIAIGASLGLTSAQIDALFVTASTL